MSKKSFDFWVVVALLFVAAAIWFALDLKALWGLSLFTLAPTAYLMVRRRKNYNKLLIGTGLIGLGFGLLFDPIQVLNGAWRTNTVLPSTLWGLPLVLDNLVGYIVMAIFTLTFYEHFLDDERRYTPARRWKKLALLCVALFAIILLLLFFDPHALLLNYSYFRLGILAILFPVIFLIVRPNLINKFALLAVFFFGVWLTAEYVALSLGNWTYSPASHYVGWVSFFTVSFPFEELVLWMLCYAAVVVSYYEYFIDDGR